VYVGNLPDDIREREIEDLFYKYGRIRDLVIKGGRSGPPFAFITFEDARDADDAVYGRNNYMFDRRPLRVEHPKSARPGPGDAAKRRGDFRIIVSGIPEGGSWQDLKDFCRAGGCGNVAFADVKNGEGVAEFNSEAEMERAIKSLDDTKFKGHKGEDAYVRVSQEGGAPPGKSGGSGGGGGGGRSKSRSRSRSRSKSPGAAKARSKSPAAARGGSRSRSRSPARGGSRSRSRSPARARSRSRSKSPAKEEKPADAGDA